MGLFTTSLIVIGLVGAFFGSAYFVSNIIWDDFLNDERFFTPIKLVPGGPNEYEPYDENEFYNNMNNDPDRFKPRLDPNLPKLNPEDIPGFNPKPLPMPDDDSSYELNNIPSYDLNDIPVYDLDIPVYDLNIPVYDLDNIPVYDLDNIPVFETGNIPSFNPR